MLESVKVCECWLWFNVYSKELRTHKNTYITSPVLAGVGVRLNFFIGTWDFQAGVWSQFGFSRVEFRTGWWVATFGISHHSVAKMFKKQNKHIDCHACSTINSAIHSYPCTDTLPDESEVQGMHLLIAGPENPSLVSSTQCQMACNSSSRRFNTFLWSPRAHMCTYTHTPSHTHMLETWIGMAQEQRNY